ncbi:MAG: ABC transporter substrate-binding protein [Chloroflexi bacterium]|nr:ABC transporter substrate-binding protein [Chloroflexota bacterium]
MFAGGLGLVAACTPSPPTAAPPPTPAAAPTGVATVAGQPASVQSTPAAAQPRSGGTLRTSLPSDISSLEGHLYYAWSYETSWLALDRLIEYDANAQPQPMLAESWDTTDDLRQIKFNLRKNVQFHSGREFTSDDVKYNVLRAQDPKVGVGQLSKPASWFTDIETPDRYTVVLKSDSPRPLAFDFFEYFNIVDKEAMESPDAKEKLVGTGPFKFVEWVQGDHLTFARNQSYWQTNRPYLDQVVVNVFHDSQAMIAQLEAGAVDFVRTPPLTDVNRLKSDPRFQFFVHDHAGVNLGLGFSTYTPPLDDKRVRQALNYAVDRQRWNDTALLGLGRATDLPWLPTSPAYEASKDSHYTFDLDKAKALLNDAGVTALNLDMVMTGSPEGVVVGQIYQADLARIGVTLNVMDQTAAVWADQVNNRKYHGMWWSQMSSAQLLPGTMLNTTATWGPSNNNTGYSSDAYTRVVSDSASVSDPNQQKQVYAQFNDLLLDDSWIAVVSPAVISYLLAASVHDLTPNWHNSVTYTNIWLGA